MTVSIWCTAPLFSAAHSWLLSLPRVSRCSMGWLDSLALCSVRSCRVSQRVRREQPQRVSILILDTVQTMGLMWLYVYWPQRREPKRQTITFKLLVFWNAVVLVLGGSIITVLGTYGSVSALNEGSKFSAERVKAPELKVWRTFTSLTCSRFLFTARRSRASSINTRDRALLLSHAQTTADYSEATT